MGHTSHVVARRQRATAPAMVGNVVLWKPARSLLLANYRIIQVLQEAGLPEGVINFVPLCPP